MLDGLLTVIATAIALSLPVSFIHGLAATPHTCKTYGYYLPATYLICNLAKERK